MIAYLFAVLLIPIFARLIKDKGNVAEMVKLSFTILFTIAVIVAIGSSIYSNQIMTLLYRLQVVESTKVFELLIIGFIPIATTYIFGTLLTANGSLKALNIMAFSGMIMNILLNFLLIPKLHAVGSAYASLITQTFTAVLQVCISQIIFKFHINMKYLFTLVFFVIGVFCLNYFLQLSVPNWKAAFLIAGFGSVVWAFILRLMSLQGFLRIIKNE